VIESRGRREGWQQQKQKRRRTQGSEAEVPCVDGTKRVPRTTLTTTSTTKEIEKERKRKGKERKEVCAATMSNRLSSRLLAPTTLRTSPMVLSM
jgi:hypothetical protein